MRKRFRKKPEIQISSVKDFVDHVDDWTLKGVYPTAFRGQSFYGWIAKPKLFREEGDLYNNEYRAIRDIVSIHPSEFDSDKTMFDRLVRMQHFGLPTRLMDVTHNPLVALWFATEDYEFKDEHKTIKKEPQGGIVTAYYVPESRQKYFDSDRVSCMANIANLNGDSKTLLFKLAEECDTPEDFIEKSRKSKDNGSSHKDVLDELYYNIGMEKPHFRPLLNPKHLLKPVYVKPKLSNKRILAQSGAFMLWGTPVQSISSTEKAIPGQSIFIAPEDKGIIRTQLQRLGIYESMLFPEIEKAAKFIASNYMKTTPDMNDI